MRRSPGAGRAAGSRARRHRRAGRGMVGLEVGKAATEGRLSQIVEARFDRELKLRFLTKAAVCLWWLHRHLCKVHSSGQGNWGTGAP